MSQINRAEAQKKPEAQIPFENDWEAVDEGEGQDDFDFGSDLENGESQFQKKDLTRDQVVKLFSRAAGRPDQAKVEKDLREILRDLASGKKEEAWGEYEQVVEKLGPEEKPGEKVEGEESNNPYQPTRVEDIPGYGKAEIYDNLQTKDYSFTPEFKEGSIKTHKILSNGGKVVINGVTSKDTAEVKKLGDGSYEVRIHKDGLTDEKSSETYIVEGPPRTIVINTLAKNIQSTLPQDDTVVQLGTGADSNNVNWDASKIAGNIPPGEGSKEAQDLLSKVDAAMKGNETGKWKEVTDYLNSTWPSQNQNHNPSVIGSTVIRKLMTALYKTAGSNDEKLKNLLSKVDPGFRREMVRCLDHFATGTNIYRVSDEMNGRGSTLPPDTYYGKDAKAEGDQWGNAAARDIVSAAPQNPVGGSSIEDAEV